MVNALSIRLSLAGYNCPTIVEMFGLKNPLPIIIAVNPIHISEIPPSAPTEALKNIKNCPIDIKSPPIIILRLFPKNLSHK